MGWRNVFNVEIDPFCQRVLRKNFPNSEQYGDIKQFNGTRYRGQIDILTGGFPCQPFSAAGHRRGKDDDRFLWPEMLRVIREIEPTWVVGENVFGILTDEMATVFEGICSDMESMGYSIQPIVIPASAVEAPHQRNRVWFVANLNGIEWKERSIQASTNPKESPTTFEEFREFQFVPGGDYTFSFRGKDKSFICGEDDGLPRTLDITRIMKYISDNGTKEEIEMAKNSSKNNPSNKMRILRIYLTIAKTSSRLEKPNENKSPLSEMPYKSGLCEGEMGSTQKEKTEMRDMQKMVPGKMLSRSQDMRDIMPISIGEAERYVKVVSQRADRIKSLGNAIVPQVALSLFQSIQSTL